MKVGIVNTSDITGGAARAAYRLHQALRVRDVDSEMLVARAVSDDLSIRGPVSSIGKGLHYLSSRLDSLPSRRYPSRSRTPFSVARVGAHDLLQRISASNPDIVHLHWINGGFVGVHQLPLINRPLVWSLHDMWAFTGGCHYNNEGCRAFEQSCGRCPVLGSTTERDLSRRIWDRKRRFFDKVENLTVVGLSRWLADEASTSALFAGRPVVNLPNPIDCSVYRPIDRTVARELWGISPDAKVVAFGAMSATSDSRKGYDLLVEALRHVSVPGLELLVFGASASTSGMGDDLPFRVHYTGRLHDDVSLVTLYNSADVMVVPSRQENLSNAIMESLACGTPVVGFDIGGNGDMVDHRVNGYLAEAYETQDLAAGIEWVLNGGGNGRALREAAREKVLREFDYPVVAQQYTKLYEQILSGETRAAAVR
ncbi:Glycosyltransferase involved in cell wall bisynthesis [Alkalispirochaeta americana]|uniref:Glycosyltransferase involved in cell wall bisynthesis n=1 Tax=Alkalispirochaeta americana TaxID=159291 RepID=A0A1N6XKF2_9SPIO|nr:glycosyltransferase family 4 protein [Alkalispirochaeta americana]SIR02825.1 Glycosyltransferase involved in cell wall bisynthesis [Alkalispirochaeta americana]